MSTKLMKTFVGICALTMAVVCAAPLLVQSPASKDKPAMYSYVSFWNIPRAQWAEMEKADAADQTILNKAIADGNLIGFGNDVNLVHQPDGSTNDEWWSSMSMAGLIYVLEQFYKVRQLCLAGVEQFHQALRRYLRQPSLQLASGIGWRACRCTDRCRS